MGYVITVVGAGGKTTYLRNTAQRFLRAGKRVAVTTTTHIWPPHGNAFSRGKYGKDLDGSSCADMWSGMGEEPDYYGHLEPTGKLSTLSDELFERICEEYDVVLVEGDGSHCMPVKLPGADEPVIPAHTDEIVVLMGAHAIGRRLDVVCQRYPSSGVVSRVIPETISQAGAGASMLSEQEVINGKQKDVTEEQKDITKKRKAVTERQKDITEKGKAVTEDQKDITEKGKAVTEQQKVITKKREIVTEKMLEEIAERYYILPLGKRYPQAEIKYELSRMPQADGKVVAVLMASGFGRRYGGNKLLDMYEGMPLYHHALKHVEQVFRKENMVVVTQYGEIINEVSSMGIEAVMNSQAKEGIAASIRLGTEWAMKESADGVIFFAADMPNLPSCEIDLYRRQFLDSGKPFGCMVFGPEHTCTNPGAFRLDTGAKKLLELTGDRGAMRIMKKEPWNIYYYQIARKCCEDIDIRPVK